MYTSGFFLFLLYKICKEDLPVAYRVELRVGNAVKMDTDTHADLPFVFYKACFKTSACCEGDSFTSSVAYFISVEIAPFDHCRGLGTDDIKNDPCR